MAKKNNKNKKLSKIFNIISKVETLSFDLQQAKSYLSKSDYDSFIEASKKAEKSALKVSNSLRRLVAENIYSPKEMDKHMAEMCDIANVKIENIGDDVIKISFPIIYPFKELKDIIYFPDKHGDVKKLEVLEKTDAMLYLLGYALNQYVAEHKIDKNTYKNCTILFLNKFKTDNGLIPDTDNYSYKGITDLIALHFLNSDAYNEVSFIHKSELSDKTVTEIYINPHNNFVSDLIISNKDRERKTKALRNENTPKKYH